MLELRNVSCSYDGGRSLALRDITLSVARGELLALVGESGSGKSTLLKLVNRLVEPTAGTILLNGEDVYAGDPVQLRRRIGYVFQGIGLLPHWTVAQNVASVPRLLGWDSARIDRRVEELLALVGLDPDTYRARRPATLSGGQAQRVGVARALAAEPQLLLMDEPFGALDAITRQELQGELDRLHRQLGITIVMVTHDAAEALLLADRIAVLRDGEIVALGTGASMFAADAHPYARQLFAAPLAIAARIEAVAGGAG